MSTITVEMDKSAFLQEAKDLLDGSNVLTQVEALLDLKWPSDFLPPALFGSMQHIMVAVGSVASAIEVAKMNAIKKQDPDGTLGLKFDKALALETAVDLLDTLVVFKGWLGALVEKVDRPVLMLLISVYVQSKPKNWLDEAKKLLGQI